MSLQTNNLVQTKAPPLIENEKNFIEPYLSDMTQFIERMNKSLDDKDYILDDNDLAYLSDKILSLMRFIINNINNGQGLSFNIIQNNIKCAWAPYAVPKKSMFDFSARKLIPPSECERVEDINTLIGKIDKLITRINNSKKINQPMPTFTEYLTNYIKEQQKQAKLNKFASSSFGVK